MSAMSTFVFKAIDARPGDRAGEIDAESKQAVSDQLRGRGLIVLELEREGRLEARSTSPS